MDPATEHLIERATRGDAIAVDDLLEQFLPGLRTFVRLRAGRLVLDRESAADVVQSACREVLEHLDRFEHGGEEGFRRWLYRAALRKIADRYEYHRAAKRDIGRAADPPTTSSRGPASLLPSPSEHAMAGEQAERIEAALERLSEDQREIICLSRYAGFSNAEIAAEMGRSDVARTFAVVARAVSSCRGAGSRSGTHVATMHDAGDITDPDLVRDLVAQCLDRLQEGAEDAVTELCDRHPEHAAAVRRRLRQLETAGLLDAPAAVQRSVPGKLGGFVLGPRIGGGGMGVVYRAEEVKLRRQVALKVVRPELVMFGNTVARFRREIEAVASLQHPGIVPVLSVGEQDGLPYFAMELVAGCSLAEALQDLRGRPPESLRATALADLVRRRCGAREREETDTSRVFTGTWVQACLRMVRDVAQALNHAHHRRIVHRDVKPSNIMVTATGRVMLVDFGLAQLERDEKLTSSGSMLGSLGYMSPEQVRGDTLDERTDIYSLGVTLYELLTLREPFAGGTQAEIVKGILEREPAAPRSLNPSIPRDVETVCRMTMAKHRGERYPSMADLARDIDNVLEMRPIEARRPSAAVRTTRWVQRNRAVSSAIALAAVLVVGGPTTFGLYERWSREAIEHQRNRAQQNLRRVRGVVEQQLRRIEEIATVPGVQGVYHALVTDALAQFEEILAQVETERESDPLLRRDIAETHSLVADLQRRLGRRREAIAARSQSIAQWELVSAAQPEDLEHRIAWAEVLRLRSADRMAVDDIAGAKSDADSAVAMLQSVLDLQPEPPVRTQAVTALAVTLGRRSLDLIAAGEGIDEATVAAERALGLWGEVGGTVAADPALQTSVLELHEGLGKFRYRTSDFEAAENHFQKALAVVSELARQDRSAPSYRARIADVQQSLCSVYGSTGRFDQARSAATESTEIYRDLAADYPQEPDYAARLSRGLLNLVLIDDYTRRITETTVAQVNEAVHLLRELAAKHAHNTFYAIQLSEAHCHAAIVEEWRDRHNAAAIEPHYRDAMAVIEDRLQSRPNDPELHYQVGAALSNYASWKRSIGEAEVALGLLDAGLPHKLRALELNPKSHDYVRSLRNHYFLTAQIRAPRDELEPAMTALFAAESYTGENDGLAFSNFAGVATRCSELAGDSEDKARYTAQAMKWLRTAVEKGWPGAAHLAKDRNFKSLRNQPGFAELVELGHAPGRR